MHMQKEETTGDHQEFDEMYRRTQAEIYKFIRYRVADKELAKDVLQRMSCKKRIMLRIKSGIFSVNIPIQWDG